MIMIGERGAVSIEHQSFDLRRRLRVFIELFSFPAVRIHISELSQNDQIVSKVFIDKRKVARKLRHL